MRTTAIVFGFVLALAVGLVATAEARDIEITVPVRVVSLHPTITIGRVECAALTGLGNLDHMVDQARYTDFTLTGGSFSGDIMVRLTIGPATMPNVHAWRCELRFARPYEASAKSLSMVGGPFFHEEFRLAPGSESRFQVEGTL